MLDARFTRVLAALVAAGALASCSDTSVLDSAGARGHRGVGHHHEAGKETGQGDKKGPGHVSKQQAGGSATKSSTGSGRGAPRSAGTEHSGPVRDAGSGPKAGTQSDTGADARAAQPAVSCFEDGTGDLEGTDSAPSYADLRKGCVREDGSQIVLEATTVAAPPARMPDKDTDLAIGFQLLSEGKKYYVSAEETENGWTAYLTQGKTRQDLDAPQVSGSVIRIGVPVSALGGAQRLDWRVESSWLRSTLVSTDYAFDGAPNGGGTETFTKS